MVSFVGIARQLRGRIPPRRRASRVQSLGVVDRTIEKSLEEAGRTTEVADTQLVAVEAVGVVVAGLADTRTQQVVVAAAVASTPLLHVGQQVRRLVLARFALAFAVDTFADHVVDLPCWLQLQPQPQLPRLGDDEASYSRQKCGSILYIFSYVAE